MLEPVSDFGFFLFSNGNLFFFFFLIFLLRNFFSFWDIGGVGGAGAGAGAGAAKIGFAEV